MSDEKKYHVFNLTDIETPLLKQRNMVNHTFSVGSFLVEPGKSVEVEEVQIAHLRQGLQALVAIGALAVGSQPPAQYVVNKERVSNLAAQSGGGDKLRSGIQKLPDAKG